MQRITHRSTVFFLIQIFSRAFLALLILPSLLAAEPWYVGIGLDVLSWSGEGVLDSETYEPLDSGLGATLLVGYRFNSYLSLEAIGYQSGSVYLRESDSDYLAHSILGLGPRLSLLDVNKHKWTPWFSYYGTYQFVERWRPSSCCNDNSIPIHTMMDGTGSSQAMGLDIKIAENTVLQFAYRESSVWADWDDPDIRDARD